MKSPLDDFIDCVFIENFFSKKQNQGVINRIVPDNTVELILTDKPFVRQFSETADMDTFFSHISGLKTRWQDITLSGSPIISIRFKPDKLFQLTGIPAYEFKNQAFLPDDIFGVDFSFFQDELFGLNNIDQKLSLVERYFSDKIKSNKFFKEDALFREAKEMIQLQLGNVEIKNLAKQFKVSQKTLENKFKLYLGVTPKLYCRLNRFISCVKKSTLSKQTLTHWAYESNFSDQSHFIKDIKEFTGLSPKAFFSKSRGIQADIF